MKLVLFGMVLAYAVFAAVITWAPESMYKAALVIFIAMVATMCYWGLRQKS